MKTCSTGLSYLLRNPPGVNQADSYLANKRTQSLGVYDFGRYTHPTNFTNKSDTYQIIIIIIRIRCHFGDSLSHAESRFITLRRHAM